MGTIKGLKDVELRFETNGVVDAINFKEADVVKRGDIIAVLNQQDAILKLEYAQAKLKTSQTQMLTAKKKLEKSEWVGEIGKRMEFVDLVCVDSYPIQGQFGESFFNKFLDGHNNSYTWKTGLNLRGDIVSFKATVKAHEEFRGKKSAILTRGVILQRKEAENHAVL